MRGFIFPLSNSHGQTAADSIFDEIMKPSSLSIITFTQSLYF